MKQINIRNKIENLTLANIFYYIVILWAASLHFYFDLFIFDNKIRMSTSDFLIPVIVGFLLLANHRLQNLIKQIDSRILLIILCISVWILFSLVIGKVNYNVWNAWALYNKTIGWFVLITYFFLGFAVTVIYRESELFVKSLIFVGVLISLFFLFRYSFHYFGIHRDYSLERIEGYFTNPNAFSFMISILLIFQLVMLNCKYKINKWILATGIAICALTLALSGSRSAFLGLAFSAPFLLLMNQLRVKSIIFIFASAITVISIVIGTTYLVRNVISTIDPTVSFIDPTRKENCDNEGEIFENHCWKEYGVYVLRDDYLDIGVNSRIEHTKRAIELFKIHPITGTGLGGFIQEQIGNKCSICFQTVTSKDHSYSTLHTTGLWIATEMGIIGALLFMALFLYLLKIMWQHRDDEKYSHYFISMIGVMILFAGVTIGTDVLYQRYLWVLFGIAAGLSYITKREFVKEGL